MSMKQQFVQVELADGTISEPMRFRYQDKLAVEKTSKARGWTEETDNVSINGFAAFIVAKREGIYAGSWEDWNEHDLVDFFFETTDVTPTKPGA